MLWGAGLGVLAGLAGTVISMFQVKSGEATRGELVAAGLLVGVPLATVAGAGAGWVWGLFFGTGNAEPTAPSPAPPRDGVGQRQGDPRRRKRR